MDEQLKKSALDYHRRPPPGKISVLPTKQLTNQRDLALAYSPGVAAAWTAAYGTLSGYMISEAYGRPQAAE